MNCEILVAYATYPDKETASQICERLVSEGTVACANIFEPHVAVYRWNERLMRDSEVAVLFKTSALKKAALMERVRATHPYQNPCLVFLKVEGGLPGFLQWVYSQSL